MNKNVSPQKITKTAQKVLAAARSVFAQHGYSGTHMDEIAQRANVNKATIYYQIGDKDTLYASVIHQVIGNVAEDIVQSVGLEKTPKEKLKAYILSIAQAVDKNPEIPSIMMREIASGGVTLPRLVVEDIASVIMTLTAILEEGAKKGVFIETVPFLVHMMILGSILLYKGSIPVKDRQTWLPKNISDPDKFRKVDIAQEVAKLILRAVAKKTA